MHRFAGAIAALAITGGVASAQTTESKGYAEVYAQSAFGNVTSQSFGVEAGVTVAPNVSMFIDAGQVRDTAPSSLGAAAQAIAGVISTEVNGVSYGVKRPVTSVVGGVRYSFAQTSYSNIAPYVLAGIGGARVKNDVTFSVAGTDVTNNLAQYGITLGTDLSGSSTKPIIALGGGVAWTPIARLVVDVQYRYGRAFAYDGININRAGVGVGVRF